MKTQLVTLIFTVMIFNCWGQKVAYNANGKRIKYQKEDVEIRFSQGIEDVKLVGGTEFAGTALLSTIVDIGFKVTSDFLEKQSKKYSAEYIKQKSNLEAGINRIPTIHFDRTLTLVRSTEKALSMIIRPIEVAELTDDGVAFVYSIDELILNYSKAKSTSKRNTFDYSIEIKPVILTDGEKKVIEMQPIVINSTEYGQESFEDAKHRTDVIIVPRGAHLTEVSLKIVETNPAKVRAEKVLELWNENKDQLKVFVEGLLPE